MKKALSVLVLCWSLNSCDDGDLQIEEVDFDAVGVQSCPGIEEPTETTFFFKIDEDEALLLQLAEGLLVNETSEPGTLTSTIPDASQLIYRLFSDNVSADYFCDALPPLEPTVLKENPATAGDIGITTKVDTVTATAKTYSHTIAIQNLALVNDQGEQLTDLSVLEYGEFLTSPSNSATLSPAFSNYIDQDVAECQTPPVAGSLRLTKLINDEYIALDVPEDEELFINMATDTIPRSLPLTDSNIFKYIILDTIATDVTCTATFGEDVKSWTFASTAGNLNVETVATAPDANGTISYVHTITLTNIVLEGIGENAGEAPVEFAEIPLIEFGTYTTTGTE